MFIIFCITYLYIFYGSFFLINTNVQLVLGSVTPRRRVKYIGYISYRQFQRQLKNELQVINN